LDQLNLVPFSCGGASDAPQLAARVRRRSFTTVNLLLIASGFFKGEKMRWDTKFL
jgi:hypothetical protein